MRRVAMNKQRPYPIFTLFFAMALLFLWGSCSTTQHLPEGEQLYIGISKTRILHEDGSTKGQRALSAAENVIQVPPNNSLFGSARYRLGFPIGLYAYNRYVNDSTRLGKKFFEIFASEPILISTVNPSVRSAIATNILKEHGYFFATVTDSVETLAKDSKKARVHYTIDMDKPFLLDSIAYLPPIALGNGSSLSHHEISGMKSGEQFQLETLLQDRENISNILRDKGFYYYRPDLIYYEADTVKESYKVQIRTKVKDGISPLFLKPWTIEKVIVSIDGHAGEEMTDSVTVGDIIVRYKGKKPAVRTHVLGNRIALKPHTYYSQEAERHTRLALSRLGAFAYTDFQFRPIDSLNQQLALYINAVLDRPWDTAFEGNFKVKSNNFLGPGARLSLSRRNAFRGGETVTAGIFGSYEWQTGRNAFGKGSLFNSYEFGADLGLSAPSIFLPFINSSSLAFPTTTDISLRASLLNRARYYRMFSVGASMVYNFEVNSQHHHAVTPISLQFNLLDRGTDIFQQILKENPVLGLSLRSQFIPQLGYTYTYDNTFNHRGKHHVWMEYSFFEAGNLVNALYAIKEPYNKTKKLFGVPFAQYVKGTADLHYTYTINRKQALATRLSTGVIYSFGNMKVAPYSEQFYVGGANSIRAYTVRSIGPGSYRPRESRLAFIDQAGEFKLEANIEWRMRLAGDLHGALFLDAGNVWLLRPDEYRPGGALSEISSVKDFFDQIALGTGFGLRYDLSFFVVRVDVGIGLHLPYDTGKKGYYNIPRFWDAIGYHFAIGYPF